MKEIKEKGKLWFGGALKSTRRVRLRTSRSSSPILNSTARHQESLFFYKLFGVFTSL